MSDIGGRGGRSKEMHHRFGKTMPLDAEVKVKRERRGQGGW